jgi:hypothetical protein
MKLKKSKRNTSIRKRFAALTSNDIITCERLEKEMLFAVLYQEILEDEEDKEICDIFIDYCMKAYVDIMIDVSEYLERPVRKEWTIAKCKQSPDWVYNFLRLQVNDLDRFYLLLGFQEKIVFKNGSSMSGEEVFIRGMYELTTGETKVSIADKFGRHYTDQTRAFSKFIDHVYYKFHHLVDNNLAWWFQHGHIKTSAKLIQEKMKLTDHENHFAMFIDCNCLETCRPGGGPAESGPNSIRWDPLIQQAFYNGWKSVHGLKHQTIDSAQGLTVDIYGPTSLRRNDLTLLAESNIVPRVRAQNQMCYGMDNENHYYIFGDSAYSLHSHLRSYMKNVSPTSPQGKWNSAMKKTRISIEWNYMRTLSLFAYIAKYSKFKLLQSGQVSKIYITCTFLRNCITCLYGDQCSKYFGYSFPNTFLEEYIHQLPPSASEVLVHSEPVDALLDPMEGIGELVT